MNYSTFKKFAECGLRIAQDLAVANGVTLAQAQLWIAQITAERQAPLTVKSHNF